MSFLCSSLTQRLFSQMFNFFKKFFEFQIEKAKKEGTFSEGLVDIMAPSVRLVGKPRIVFAQHSRSKQTSSDESEAGADEKRQNLTWHKIIEVDRGMSFEQAVSDQTNCNHSPILYPIVRCHSSSRRHVWATSVASGTAFTNRGVTSEGSACICWRRRRKEPRTRSRSHGEQTTLTFE